MQATGNTTIEKMNGDAKLSFTSKTKAMVKSLTGSDATEESTSGSNGGGSSNTNGTNPTNGGGTNTGGDNTGGDNTGGGGNPGGGMDQN